MKTIYIQLLSENGYTDITSTFDLNRTSEKRHFVKGRFMITIDGINLLVLENNTKEFEIAFSEIGLCLAIAYCELKTIDLYQLNDFNPERYLKGLKNQVNESSSELDKIVMDKYYQLQVIRQNLNK